MKFIAIFLVFFAVSGTIAAPVINARHNVASKNAFRYKVKGLHTPIVEPKDDGKLILYPGELDVNANVGMDLSCTGCVEFFDDTMNLLLNAALEIGVLGTCEELCVVALSSLPQFMQFICVFACMVEGMMEFVHLLQTSDLQPNYLCARLHFCNANECESNCVKFISVDVQPSTAPVRSTFNIIAKFNVTADTGTGYTVVNVANNNVMGGIVEYAVLNDGFKKGSVQSVSIPVTTDQFDWIWPAATYPVEVFSCAYGCTDQHGVVFAKKDSQFTVTGSPPDIVVN